MICVQLGKWDVLITDDMDYVNFTHLTTVNDLCLSSWLDNITTRVIMQHLEDLGMSPAYKFEEQYYVRIELLHTILSPLFMSLETPTLPDFFVRDLIDMKMSQAKDRMGKEPPCISLRERRCAAVSKVDATSFALSLSEDRLNVLEEFQTWLEQTPRSAKDLASEGTWKCINSMIMELRFTVEEISPLIVKLHQLDTDPAKRKEAINNLHEDLRDLNSAIRCEIAIRKVEYRMILAQLMIHEAFTMSVEAMVKST